MMKLSVIQLAQELLRINSINPKCLSEWAKSGSEKHVAEWLVNYLQPFGFQHEYTPADAARPNLLVRHKSFQPELPIVAFEAHMDTVDVEGMAIDPFEGEIRNQRLYGRGSCDVKGSMAAMIATLVIWYTSRQSQSPFNLMFIGSMGVMHQPVVESWYSDAGNFGLAGYDAIIWGAGDIAQSHTSEEFVSLDQLQSAGRVLENFAAQCERYYSSR